MKKKLNLKQKAIDAYNWVKPRAKKVGKTCAALFPWLAAGATIYAAWDGSVTSEHNERRIRELEAKNAELGCVVNHNADELNWAIGEIERLQNENEKLLDEAAQITEGKEGAA